MLSQRKNSSLRKEKDKPQTHHESRLDAWLSVLPSGLGNLGMSQPQPPYKKRMVPIYLAPNL